MRATTIEQSFNEGRGFTPGDTGTATTTADSKRAFNEGRGFTPGDTNDAGNDNCIAHTVQ